MNLTLYSKEIEKLKSCKTRLELWDNLPEELAYDKDVDNFPLQSRLRSCR